MAKILLSDEAPREEVQFSLANYEPFKLSGKKSHETIDPDALANAEAHPWLKVEYPDVTVVQGEYAEQINPKDDPLSRFNSTANDPEAAKKAAAEAAEDVTLVAIDAGLDQDKVLKEGEVAETLAADPTSKTSDKKGS